MRSAVYFPFVHPNEELMKRSLLTWDIVEVPQYSKSQCDHLHDSAFSAAYELVCRPIEIDDGIKRGIENILIETEKEHIPPYYLYDPYWKKQPYPDWFLLPSTSELLLERGLAANHGGQVYVGLSPYYLLLGLLGDVAAGKTKQRLTDDPHLYKGLCQMLGKELPADDRHASGEIVLSLALKTANLSKVPLEALVDYRKRESSEQRGDDFRQLRYKFVDNLSKWAERLSDPTLSSSDRKELIRQCEEELERDLRAIQNEIRAKGIQLVLSKEIFATSLASLVTIATSVIAPQAVGVAGVTAGIAGIGAIYAARSKFFETRRDVLKAHPMAYLYELSS